MQKAPNWLLFLAAFAAVALTHATLLHLPYYWDEGGYYIPAALDFYHHGQIIPVYTNAHTPLDNILLGTLWHITGLHIVATRLFTAAFAAIGLVAVYRLASRLLTPAAGFAVALLTVVYPIWFAQSTLAHADIYAAAFSLCGFAVYFNVDAPRRNLLLAVLFSLAVMAKETALVQPITLAAIELYFACRSKRREYVATAAALCFPLVPLVAWFGYHRIKTGFTFGNPEYLRYNATANFTVAHVLEALRYRFVHLFWQRNIWLPCVLALACLLLPRRKDKPSLSAKTLTVLGLLIAANWVAFSILGGALLTRYLLPVYPLILILCVAVWMERFRAWQWLAALSAAAFVAAIWLNPPTAFAPEDNLTYRDMIVVHQEAIDYVASHYADPRVLTAWPVSTDMARPDLGYTTRPIKIDQVESFTLPQMQKASQNPGDFDTAIIFTQHYLSPSLQRYLKAHPNSARGREFLQDANLSPQEIAAMLHGDIVWHTDRNGEWAYVIRFNRSYEAQNTPVR